MLGLGVGFAESDVEMRRCNNDGGLGLVDSCVSGPSRRKRSYNTLPLSVNHNMARFFSFWSRYGVRCGGCADVTLLRVAPGSPPW
jgi:hypothetical protein